MGCFYSICHQTAVKPDKCVVCMENCNTLACKCSCMHKECALKFIKYNQKCYICNSNINTTNLEMQPCMSLQQSKELQNILKKGRKSRAQKRYKIKLFSTRMFPHLIRFYDRHNIYVNSPYLAIQNIVEDTENKNQFIQYLLNKGEKQSNVDEDLETLIKLYFEYSILQKRTKQLLNDVFKKYNYNFINSDSEIDITIF